MLWKSQIRSVMIYIETLDAVDKVPYVTQVLQGAI